MMKRLFGVKKQSYSPLSSQSTNYGSITTQQPEGSPESRDQPDDAPRLRRVSDTLPLSVWLINVMEFSERFAYFGLVATLQNYIQNSRSDPLRPGGLGLGQASATRLNQFFTIWCYLTPIIGALAADQYLGRFQTIVYSSLIYILGLSILFITSLPVAVERDLAYGGLVTAMVLIGAGTGGLKPNVSTLMAEQNKDTEETAAVLGTGERVVLDPELTVQRMFLMFFLCANIGSVLAIGIATETERHFDFCFAFALLLIVYTVGFGVFLRNKRSYVTRHPEGSTVFKAFRAFWIAIKHKGDLEFAKPSHQSHRGRPDTIIWDDSFVDELRRALVACKVFVFFPFYWASYSQLLTNFVSQAGTMETHAIPNDIMTNIDPLTVLIFVPILDRIVYPYLQKMGVQFRPITRITWGFVLCSFAMAYAAIVQHLIYQAPPCYDHPLAADCEGGKVPNRIHVAVQTPAYLLIALSEILAAATGYEYAYTKAPPSMKSFVTALFLFTISVGGLLAVAVTPWTVDPKLIGMYSGLCIETFVVGIAFWFIFRGYNQKEVEMNRIDNKHDRMPALVDEAG